MNNVQKLLEIENQKKELLKKSENETSAYYYCFVNLIPVEFYSSKLSKGAKRHGVHLHFEIISFSSSDYHNFYSLVFEVTLENKINKDKQKELKISYTSGVTKKSINQSGVFLINNYEDLTSEQRKQYLNKIKKHYKDLEDPYDSIAINGLETYNIIDYIKVANKALYLEDFLLEINKRLDTIIENNISQFKEYSIEKTFNTPKVEKMYLLTEEEKNKLKKDIKKNFKASILRLINEKKFIGT